MQIGKGNQGVRIGEYPDMPDTNAVIGWIEPNCENPQWILWFTAKGDAIFYTKRETDTGEVIGEPIRSLATGNVARKNKPK